MRKSMSKKLVAMVTLISMVSTTTVYGLEINKDESVYITLDSDGKIENKIVSAWIHSDEEGIEIKDKAKLENIKNVKGEEKPKIDGEDVTWNLEGNDLYYRGDAKEEIPLEVTIKYYLDDKEISPNDIKGKDGNIKIELEFKNNSYKEVEIKGEERKIYTPLVTVGEVAFSLDKFSNVKVDGGSVISEGNNNIVVFTAFPGMEESLGLKDFNIDLGIELRDKIVIEAEAKDFEMGSIMMVSTTKLPEFKELESSSNIDELKEALDKLKDGSSELLDGTGKLKDGVNEGKNKLQEAKKSLEDPKTKEKLGLIMDNNKVSRANTLIDHGYFAKDLDTSKIKEILPLITEENLYHGNVLMEDGKVLIKNAKTFEEYIKKVEILKKDKELNELLNSGLSIKKQYDAISPNTKDKLNILLNATTNENIIKGQNLVKGALNTDKDMNNLIGGLLKATGTSNINDAIKVINNNLNNAQKALGNENLGKLQGMGKDFEKYGQSYLILKSYMVRDMKEGLDFNKAKEKAISTISMVYGEQGNMLIPMINSMTINDFTKEAMNGDALKLSSYKKYMDETVKEIKGVAPGLNGVQAILNGGELQRLLGFYGTMKENEAFIKPLMETYLSLNEEDINSIVEVKNSVSKVSKGIEENKDKLDGIEKAIGDFTHNNSNVIEEINKFKKDLNDASGLISTLENLASNKENIDINGTKDLITKLMIMQNDLKESEDILRITKDSLAKGNIDRARNLINSLPKLQEGIETLADGTNKLNDGMKKFNDEGIEKLHKEGNEKIEDIDKIMDIKDEVVNLSKEYDSFSGKGEGINSNVKFIIKTKEIRNDSKEKDEKVKKEVVKETTKESKGLLGWIKGLFS